MLEIHKQKNKQNYNIIKNFNIFNYFYIFKFINTIYRRNIYFFFYYIIKKKKKKRMFGSSFGNQNQSTFGNTNSGK